METRKQNGNTESTAHACSQVPSCTDLTCDAATAHVFFEVYLPVSALVLSGTQLPQFPDQSRSFGRLFSRLFVMFVLLTHVFISLYNCSWKCEFTYSLVMLCLYC